MKQFVMMKMVSISPILVVVCWMLLQCCTTTTTMTSTRNQYDGSDGRVMLMVEAYQHHIHSFVSSSSSRKFYNHHHHSRTIGNGLLFLHPKTTTIITTNNNYIVSAHYQQQRRFISSPLYFFGNNNNNNNKDNNNNNNDDDDETGSTKDDKPLTTTTTKEASDSSNDGNKSNFLSSFFNRMGGGGNKQSMEAFTTSTATTTAVENIQMTTTTTTTVATDTTNNKTIETIILSPTEMAQKFRSDAERVRLEAERLDAELTLRKIEKLERDIQMATLKQQQQQQLQEQETVTTTTTATNKGKKNINGEDITEKLQREMDTLQAKLRSKDEIQEQASSSSSSKLSTTEASISTTTDTATAAAVILDATTTTTTNGDTGTTTSSNSIKSTMTKFLANPEYSKTRISQIRTNYQESNVEEYNAFMKTFRNAPGFQRRLITMVAGLEYNETEANNNITQYATKVYQMKELDFSSSTLPIPIFTMEQVKEREQRLLQYEKLPQWVRGDTGAFHPILYREYTNGIAQNNITDYAILSLEYEYYSNPFLNSNANEITSDNNNTLMMMMTASATEPLTDRTIEEWYPQCTRKIDKETGKPLMEPTLQQVNTLISNVLPKSGFQVLSKQPEKVLGGYVIRGQLVSSSSSSSSETTTSEIDDFISKLDTIMLSTPVSGSTSGSVSLSGNKEQTSLADTMTVLVVDDFTAFAMETDFTSTESLNAPPILYITSPNIVRESKPIQLSIVTGLGIATTWYMSLYPFLLNPTLYNRVEEQIALVDANMIPDLSFVTDLSVPLFTSFLAIQLLHELAHTVAASIHNFKISVPTLVPSFITGITSTVTTFRSVPKNRIAMFDFALSGPLVGMVASILCIIVGAQFTLSNTNSMIDSSLVSSSISVLPQLPLELLRQSTLGGGIINAILGNGALSVPVGALGTQAVAEMTVPLHPLAIAGYISLIVNALSVLPIGTTDGGRICSCLFGKLGKSVIGSLTLFIVFGCGFFGDLELFLYYFAFVVAFQTGEEIPCRNNVETIFYSNDIPRLTLALGTLALGILTLVPFQS